MNLDKITKKLKKLHDQYDQEAKARQGYLDRDEVSRSERGEVQMAADYCQQFAAELDDLLKKIRNAKATPTPQS